ncbi:hypothetical protein [Streptomyces minutiscleroticus]|uniref:hypothetical protein n=1 Tax=Streptomyces minutiscleroticus TaxID=68238 RepID=UPI003328AA94
MSPTRRQVTAATAASPAPEAARDARRPRTVHIAGDSTAARKYADAAPETGYGTALPTHGEYPAAMRALAEEEHVALLDVQALPLALWQRLGPEGTKTYFNRTATEQDNTHFDPPGAIAVARLVARALRDRRVLAPHDVRRLGAEVPESWITWPEA